MPSILSRQTFVHPSIHQSNHLSIYSVYSSIQGHLLHPWLIATFCAGCTTMSQTWCLASWRSSSPTQSKPIKSQHCEPHTLRKGRHTVKGTQTQGHIRSLNTGESPGEHYTGGLESEPSNRKMRMKRRTAAEGESLCWAERQESNAESRGRWTRAGPREGWAAGSTEATAGAEGHVGPQSGELRGLDFRWWQHGAHRNLEDLNMTFGWDTSMASLPFLPPFQPSQGSLKPEPS